MVIVAVLEIPHRSENNPRKLRVHRDVRVIVHDFANQREFLFQVIVPHLANLDRIAFG